MKKATKASVAATVGDYLKPLSTPIRKSLQELREAIKKAAPKSEELISYQIPTYKQNGALVHFAAFPDHCSFFVVSKNIIKTFSKELKPFKTSGTTIHFSPGQPIPTKLVSRIVKTRVLENAERVAAKVGSPTAKTPKQNDRRKVKTTLENQIESRLTAEQFITRMNERQSDAELKKIQRYFKSGKGEYGEGDRFMGIRMGELFKLAQEFVAMPIVEVSKLLDSDIHEIRTGALSILDKKGRNNKTPENIRKEMYQLYVDRIDRINNWDLVDICALFVVGRYLFDKSRKVLYTMANSKNIWLRRTAIVSTGYFLRKGDVEDTFLIGEMLVNDKEDLIHKAAGAWMREAGKQAPQKLLAFLDKYAATMPRTMLRYAIEKLNPKQREYYMKLKEF